MELLESQKSSFSIFSVLKGLNAYIKQVYIHTLSVQVYYTLGPIILNVMVNRPHHENAFEFTV